MSEPLLAVQSLRVAYGASQVLFDIDAEVLDELAHRALADCRTAQGNLTVDVLSPLPTALRRRVILQWLLQSGSSGLSAAHIEAVDQLVIAWSGQRDVEVPNVRVARREGEITIDTP